MGLAAESRAESEAKSGAETRADEGEIAQSMGEDQLGVVAPLPRFTVGLYCAPPDTDPMRELLSFSLGLGLIAVMVRRRRMQAAAGVDPGA